MISWFQNIEHPFLLAVLAAACFPLYRAWAMTLFGSTDRLLLSLRWLRKRDFDSLLKGNYAEDKFAEFRLAALLFISLATPAAAYTGALKIWAMF